MLFRSAVSVLGAVLWWTAQVHGDPRPPHAAAPALPLPHRHGRARRVAAAYAGRRGRGGNTGARGQRNAKLFREFFARNDQQTVAGLRVHCGLNVRLGSLDSIAAKVEIKPYDQVFVRKNPNFEVQENIDIRGMVKYAGKYPRLDKNEKISSYKIGRAHV